MSVRTDLAFRRPHDLNVAWALRTDVARAEVPAVAPAHHRQAARRAPARSCQPKDPEVHR